MQPRHPVNFTYTNTHKTSERYTDHNKKSSYFTESGIKQLAYIRLQLEQICQVLSQDQNSINLVNQLINLMDGLADKGLGSSLTVGKRIKSLDEDLMKIFPIVNGAMSFENPMLLQVAKILINGILAIEPQDLNPPTLLLKASEMTTASLCVQIKSAMKTLGAQVNFYLQLNENALQSSQLYELMKAIDNTTADLRSYGLTKDKKNLTHRGDPTTPENLLAVLDTSIEKGNTLLQQFVNSQCTAITVHTRGVKQNPTDTFLDILKIPGFLQHISLDGYNPNGDEKEYYPVFMTTTIPFVTLKLCFAIQTLLEDLKISANNSNSDLKNSLLDRIQRREQEFVALATMLESAINRKSGEPKLKTNLEELRKNLVAELDRYLAGSTTNAAKRDLCTQLKEKIAAINLEDRLQPEKQFCQFIALIASAYYAHNAYCESSNKAPARLGDILVNAMLQLAEFSQAVCANDSKYHEDNKQNINKILHPDQASRLAHGRM